MNLLQNSELSKLLLTFFVFVCGTLSSQVPRPRGVSLSRAALYPPNKDFTCFDGSATIPFSKVNDDYCDCYDASDEPGTSACPHGIFYCTNAGHKPMNIPSNRVNDGICDCCDGTDEYGSGKECFNNCAEMGKSAREAAQLRAEVVKAGKQVRAEMSQKGVHAKHEKQNKLQELQRNKEEAEKLKQEKENLKHEAEKLENAALEYYRKLEEEAKKKKVEEEAAKNRAEALETFKKFDSNQDGLVSVQELQTRPSFDKDRNGEVSDEEAKWFLNGQEEVDFEAFINNCWTSIKPYMLMDSGLYTPPSADETVSEVDDMQEGQAEEEHEANEDEEEEETDDGEDNEEQEATPGAHEEYSVTYDDETQKLVDQANNARTAFQDAEAQVKDIESEMQRIQEYLEKDFGPEEEFAPLQGQCFEFSDHEYIYKLCPFDRTSQQPKSSSSETRLGTWGHWSGSESNKYRVQTYDKGQICWNGPPRTTIVKIDCGSENKVISVSEPNRCEYVFEFVTPAACHEQLEGSDVRDELHDEL
ncbi:unnamed protein product [Callosobruchus maculatus]|uniref:Glucosidase 2 subunit beta n=1 Tax=Callosobruchus maculatus TaxID=64391 RepID=A0A653DAV4_CALMS|nr:unnamed protein product [Callosobruchus maculatus]